MRTRLTIGFLILALIFTSSAWGIPDNWAVFVPKGARYLGSSSDSLGNFWGAPYDLTGIDHIEWFGCWFGHLCTWDTSAFEIYNLEGDYYDCQGNLLEANAPISQWRLVRGTGTIFTGGIGGFETEPVCVCETGYPPAKVCRVHEKTAPIKRSDSYCEIWPFISNPNGERNLGRPGRDTCEVSGEAPEAPSPLVGNPINVTTGNKYEEVVDVTVESPGIPLEFRRAYNSQSTYAGPLGQKWTHNYNLRLEELEKEPERRIRIWADDGRTLYFHEVRKDPSSGAIPFIGESGVKDRLKQNVSTGQYLLRRKGTNLTYRFSAKGRLLEVTDTNGNGLTLGYEGEDLVEISDNFGKSLSLEYDHGLLKTVRDPKDQPIVYEYKNGDLLQVRYPDRRSIGYGYKNHNLLDKYDCNGALIGHWDYDEERGLVTFYYSHRKGDEPQDWMRLEYLLQETRVIRPSGVTTYLMTNIDKLDVIREVRGCGLCGGVHRRYEYNERLDLISVTTIRDGIEITTRYDYDGPLIPWEQVGILTEKTEALGLEEERTTSFSYKLHPDDDLLLLELKEKRASVLYPDNPDKNRVRTWTFGGKGNLLSIEEKGYALIDNKKTLQVQETTYDYNANGQLTKINGPRTDVGDAITFEYYPNKTSEANNRGQLKSITNGRGHQIIFSEYDPNGNVEKITDPNKVDFFFTYDERNRIRTIGNSIYPETSTQYGYDEYGNVASITFPEGNGLEYIYSPSNKIMLVKDTAGSIISYDYYPGEHPEEQRIHMDVKDPQGTVTKSLDFILDSYNRLKKIINPDKNDTEYGYDGSNNLTLIRNARKYATSFGYDALNRLTEMLQPKESGDIVTSDIRTSYIYDTQDNLIWVIDANKTFNYYTYDDFGRLVSVDSLDTGTGTYRYDRGGNLLERIDAKGTRVKYTYDKLNRLSTITYPDSSENVTFTYDSPLVSYGIGRLTGRTDPSGSYTFHYDGLGNLSKEEKKIGTVTYTTQYNYNKNNALTSIVYPSGRTVRYERDGAGKVNRVETTLDSATKPLASDIGYLPFGGLTELTFGNDLPLDQMYDLQYRLFSIGVSPLLSWSYVPDPNGNVSTLTDNLDASRSKGFGYDPLDRLTHAEGIYGTIDYTYDDVGNRLTETVNDRLANTYVYVPKPTGGNRLSEVRGDLPKQFGYDFNGNITKENGKTYVYSQANRLSRVLESGLVAEYVHNGEGQRTKKTINNETKIFHYDLSGHLIAETDENGEILVEYVYLGDQILAMIAQDRIYYYHNDHLGTPQVLTDETGRVVWKADYRPFGEAEVLIEDIENSFRFPGQYFDKETGLHYNYFRDYHPGIGRYLQPDPIGLAGGLNPYVYVGNKPTTWSDRLGLFESPWYLTWVPGQHFFDLGMTAAENGQYGWAAAYFAGMVGEQVLTVLTFGQGTAVKGATSVCEGNAARGVTNPIPGRLARVIPGEGPFTTLGRPGAPDVFVTAAEDIAGMNATQIAQRIGIPSSKSFTVIEFSTPSSGLASPVFRTNPGFVGRGLTAGGAREFVLLNGSIPTGAIIRVVR
jgi:RHS repeat-associated protein